MEGSGQSEEEVVLLGATTTGEEVCGERRTMQRRGAMRSCGGSGGVLLITGIVIAQTQLQRDPQHRERCRGRRGQQVADCSCH